MKNTIIFLNRYPNDNDLKDGYFQRVLAIDSILNAHRRVYIECITEKMIFPRIRRVKKGVYDCKIMDGNKHHLRCIQYLLFFSGRVYSHSIFPLSVTFNMTLFSLARKKILDIHGVVPEEALLRGETEISQKFEAIEQSFLTQSDVLISVTEAMTAYLRIKHKLNASKKFIQLPIFVEAVDVYTKKEFSKTIIYCGGLQKWQQTEKMLDYVHHNERDVKFIFLVPNPNELQAHYRDLYGGSFPGIVASATQEEVVDWYIQASFGIVFREDIVINRVACPTKLIEYLQYGVVPIVDFDAIGDFKSLGYKYISYQDTLCSEIEWHGMVENNYTVMDSMRNISRDGEKELKELV